MVELPYSNGPELCVAAPPASSGDTYLLTAKSGCERRRWTIKKRRCLSRITVPVRSRCAHLPTIH